MKGCALSDNSHESLSMTAKELPPNSSFMTAKAVQIEEIMNELHFRVSPASNPFSHSFEISLALFENENRGSR